MFHTIFQLQATKTQQLKLFLEQNLGRFRRLMMKGGSFTSNMIKLKKEQDRIKKRQESGNFELCLNAKLIYECYEPRLRFREQLISTV